MAKGKDKPMSQGQRQVRAALDKMRQQQPKSGHVYGSGSSDPYPKDRGSRERRGKMDSGSKKSIARARAAAEADPKSRVERVRSGAAAVRSQQTGKPYLQKSRIPDLIREKKEAPKRAVAERLRSIRQGAVDSGRLPATGQQMRTSPISARKDAKVPRSIPEKAAKRVASRNMMRDPGYSASVKGGREARVYAKSLARRGVDPSKGLTSGATSIREKLVAKKMGKLARNVAGKDALGDKIVTGPRTAKDVAANEAIRNKLLKQRAKTGGTAGRTAQRAMSVIRKVVPKLPGVGALDFVSKESVDKTMEKIKERAGKKIKDKQRERYGA